jgi:hypothetical protein
MTTQYTPTLKLALPVTGELSGTWGDVVNDNITSMIEQAIAGLVTINTWTGNAHTLTTANGTTSESRCAMLVAATGAGGTALTGAGEILCPAAAKLYVLQNTTAFAITLKTSAGTGVAVAAGNTSFLFCDGTNVNACVTTIVDGNITGNLTVGGNATINGNTTLGNATSDTITATARFNTDLVPSTDNARDLGSVANSWKDLYIDGTAYLALVDINGGTIDGVSIGATTAATLINVDNLRLDGNTISSTDTNGNIVIAPNGTGDVQLDADTVRVGDSGAAATLTSNGAGALTVTTGGAADLTLSTNSGTTSGTVVIANGANGNITLTPDGTGDVILSADRVQIGDSNTDTTLTTNGTGSLNLTTNNGTNSGTIQIAQGVNGNITLTPNGTGSVSVPKLVWSNGTATRVPYLTTGGQFTDSANLTFNGTDLTVSGAVNAGSINATTLDLTNLEVTNIKAKDGTAAMTIADSTGAVAVSTNMTIGNATSDTLTVTSTVTSNLIFTDNTYDIGASGATRPRSLFLGTNLTVGSLTSTRVPYASTAGLLVDSANMTFNGTRLTVADLADSGLTSGRVTYASAGGALVDSSALTFDGATLGVNGVSVGRGAGAVATNTVVGNTALAVNTTGSRNTAVGYFAALYATGSSNTAIGISALNGASGTATGNGNTAIGDAALTSNTSGSSNTAIGALALSSNTSGSNNVAVGLNAAYYMRSSDNMAVGDFAMRGSTTPANNIGYQNTAVGRYTMYLLTSGVVNTAVGDQALYSVTSGGTNTAVGAGALYANSTAGQNTALGYQAGFNGTTFGATGGQNVFIGYQSGYNTNHSRHTIVGWGAGNGVTTGDRITAFGHQAGSACTGSFNTFIGGAAGRDQTSGTANSYIGESAGYLMTTGSKNTILGGYGGNQGGLDIRTASNNIVLSDGDGAPRFVVNGTTQNTSLPGGSGAYNSSSGTFDSTLQIGSNLQLMSFASGANTQCQFGSNVYYNGAYRAIAGGAGSSKLFIGAAGVFEFAGANALTSAGDPITYTVTLTCAGLAQTVALQGGTSVTGTGITFPGTQFASSNANTLDDYEEGTWTPSFGFSTSGSAIYSTQSGSYVKVGSLVTVSAIIVLSNRSTASGSVFVDLPFNCKGTGPINYWTMYYSSNNITLTGYDISGQIGGGIVNRLNFYNQISAGSKTSLDAGQFSNSTELIFTCTYQTSP